MATKLAKVWVRLYADEPVTMWYQRSGKSDLLLASTWDYNKTSYILYSDVKQVVGEYTNFGTMSDFSWSWSPSAYFGSTAGGWYNYDTVTYRYYKADGTNYTDKTGVLEANDYFSPNSYWGNYANNYFTSYYIGSQYVPEPSDTNDSYITKKVKGSDGYGLWCYSYYNGTTKYSAGGTTGPASYAGTKTGYTFDCWKGNVSPLNGEYAADKSISSSTSTTYYSFTPKWKANTYTVVYNKNGATGGSTANSSHTYDTAKNLTANGYTRTNYTFTGWNTQADGKGTAYANKASVKNLTSTNNGTVTLYAQWKEDTYTVTFTKNPSSWTISNIPSAVTKKKSETFKISSTAPTTTATSKENKTYTYYFGTGSSTDTITRTTSYNFSKWTTKTDGTGDSYTAGATFGSDANKRVNTTLYSQWTSSQTVSGVKLRSTAPKNNTTATATITYKDNNGGSITRGGSKVTSDTCTTTTTYTFTNKWNTKSDGTGTSYNAGSTYSIFSDLSLYAQYTPSSSTNSITLPTATLANNVTYANVNFTGSDTAIAAKRFSITTTNTFKGWTVNASGSGTIYKAGTSYSTTSAVTLYAQYTPSTTIEKVTLPTPTKSGGIFTGWYTSDGTKRGNAGDSYTPPITGETLTARWITGTIVKFNANGGSSRYSKFTFERNDGTYLTLSVPTRNGYFFNGWNTKQDGTGVDVYIWEKSTYCIGNPNATGYWSNNKWSYPGTELTLYAKWGNGNMFTYIDGEWSMVKGWAYTSSGWKEINNFSIYSNGWKGG